MLMLQFISGRFITVSETCYILIYVKINSQYYSIIHKIIIIKHII